MAHLKAALELSPAVKQLQEGCTRLGLNENMAVELVSFLHVKRRFVPGNDEPTSLLCSSSMDQLWKWMLLNTKVAREVHTLIGGQVDHASTDDEDLSDDTKVVRRLAAINLLAATGWTPTLGFWEEPDTLMHRIRRTTHGRQRAPLYVHPGADAALRGTLAGLVQAAGARLLPPADLWAQHAAAAAAAGGDDTATGGRKRKRSAAQAEATDEEELPATPPEAEQPAPPVAVTLVLYLQPNQRLQEWPGTYEHPVTHQDQPSVTMATFPCEPGSTIGSLYSAAAWYLCQDTPDQLRLFCRGQHLTDRSSSLTAAGMEGRAVVHVLHPGQELAPPFQVFVKDLAGKTWTFLVSAHTLVKEVQEMIQDRWDIPACEQRLIYVGGQLEPLRELWEYQVQEEATLHLLLRLRGC